MPVRKFRSVADMKDSPWRDPGDPELFRAIRQVWGFSERACRAHFPPGVHRHRSADDMERLRDEWEDANLRALEGRRNSRHPTG